jgi:Holliday junction resolvase
MTNSRAKGKRGELELAAKLREHGLVAYRGQQFSGGADSPDVVCESLPDIHFEVKRVERLDLIGAMAQSVRDAGDKTPVVAHRKNGDPWLVTMRLDDWLNLAKS